MGVRDRHDIVYPGHPVTLGVLIMAKYDSLESAVALGYEFPRALEDEEIPGSGESVSMSLALLRSIALGEDPTIAVARAERLWKLGGAGGYPNAVDPGQEEAEALKSLFFRMVAGWVRPDVLGGARGEPRLPFPDAAGLEATEDEVAFSAP